MANLPSLFVSHGAPTFAIEPGLAGPRLTALGRTLPRPRAVLVVSPHWMTQDVRVTATESPKTIHDFAGFDPSLYQLTYPASGDPALAHRTVQRLRATGWNADTDGERGLDHGAWVPLRHLYPDADLPVVQVSLPRNLTADAALDLGRSLAPFVQEGVLVVGSGSLTHNLYEFRMNGPEAPYAREFADWVRQAVAEGDAARLVNTLRDAPHAQRAHPTTEHFLPLLVAAGAAPALQPATVIDGGVTHGVLVMDAFVFGQTVPVRETAP